MEEADPQEIEAEDVAPLRAIPPQVLPEVVGLDGSDSVRLSAFVDHDFTAVRNIVSSLCGPQTDADEAVAEALARAVEQLAAGRSIDALSAWVTRVAINVGRSELRRQSVRRRKAPQTALPDRTESGMDAVAARLDVQAALRALTRRQAEVVALYYGLDLSVADVARVLGRSKGTIKATLSKARTTLALSLGSTTEDEHNGKA